MSSTADQHALEIQNLVMEPVTSSNVAGIAYHAASKTLKVWFKGKQANEISSVYCYFDVPAETYRGLKEANSKGKYLNAHIKGLHPCTKVG